MIFPYKYDESDSEVWHRMSVLLLISRLQHCCYTPTDPYIIEALKQ